MPPGSRQVVSPHRPRRGSSGASDDRGGDVSGHGHDVLAREVGSRAARVIDSIGVKCAAVTCADRVRGSSIDESGENSRTKGPLRARARRSITGVMDWLTTLTTALMVGVAVGYFDRLRDVRTGSARPLSWRGGALTETRRSRWRTSRNKVAEPTRGTLPSGTSFRRARR